MKEHTEKPYEKDSFFKKWLVGLGNGRRRTTPTSSIIGLSS